MKRRLVLDVETGGLDPKIHGLTQLCAFTVDYTDDWSSFEVVGRCHSFVKPEAGMIYEPVALQLQGVTLEELEEKGREIRVVLNGLRKLVNEKFYAAKKCAPIAHNAGFDKGFMDAAYARTGTEACTNHVWRCSMDLFRWLQDLGVHDKYSANLKTICEHYGIVNDKAHSAYGDVQATAEAVGFMMRDLRGNR